MLMLCICGVQGSVICESLQELW